jgi:hypothetical protein
MYFDDRVPIFYEISFEIMNFFLPLCEKSAILNCEEALYLPLL